MEKSIVFYGYYSGTDLDGAISNYDVRLAYLLVVITYFLISLVFMVHKYVTSRLILLRHEKYYVTRWRHYMMFLCLLQHGEWFPRTRVHEPQWVPTVYQQGVWWLGLWRWWRHKCRRHSQVTCPRAQGIFKPYKATIFFKLRRILCVFLASFER